MAETSLLWQSGVGDGGAYTDEELRLYADVLGLALGANVGVVPGQLNELAVTSTGNNDIRVASGRAIADGTVYENDALITFNTASPVVGTTGRRVVLQKDWAGRTIRAAIITSADGTIGLPALTQNDGTTWEIPLASFTITTGGVIGALTDEREFTRAAFPFGRYVSRAGQTRYSRPGWVVDTFAGTSGGTIGADIIFFTPILLQESRIFDRIGVRVTTLAGGENTRVGIYNAGLNSSGIYPTSLILESGLLSVAAAGPTDVEETISQRLAAGFYFLAQVVESDTPGFNSMGASSSGPVTPRGADLATAGIDVILATTIDAAADYVNNGLPATAPAVTAIHPPSRGAVILRDTS